ncbi:hypothetical protein ACIP98_27495 [Streptomyces sp. NPDC088354]|uniref:hypothetical protein n=1 Tax=Streptomyces sp. NPDC088354 TaxID=3365856 RepID=UPI0037F18F0A
MKRALTSLVLAAGLAAGAGLAAVAPASAASAADSRSYWYTGQNFSGTQIALNPDNEETAWLPAIHSVINHTRVNYLGWNGSGGSYCFWSGGSWGYVGQPFSDASYHQLAAARSYGC